MKTMEQERADGACPFCGGSVYYLDFGKDFGLFNFWCRDCGRYVLHYGSWAELLFGRWLKAAQMDGQNETCILGIGGLKVEQLKIGRKWTSVRDELPQEGRMVLVAAQVRMLPGNETVTVVTTGAYQKSVERQWCGAGIDSYFEGCDFDRDACAVTHWMPLPEPPEGV